MSENNDMQKEPMYESSDRAAHEEILRSSIKTFPIPISAEDLIKKDGEVPSRSPNAFLIYRRVVIKELQAQNLSYKMTDISSMAASFWKLEPDHVKKAYLEIAIEAKNMLTDIRH